jgi:hypothetical protein
MRAGYSKGTGHRRHHHHNTFHVESNDELLRECYTSAKCQLIATRMISIIPERITLPMTVL